MIKSARYAYIVWWLFCAAAIFGIDVVFTKDVIHQHETRSFPSTIGKVVYSKVMVGHDRKGTSRSLVLQYEYQVDGQTYQGDTISFGIFSEAQVLKDPEEESRAHPVGSQVRVYYCADNPAECLLSPGLTIVNFLIFFFIIPGNVLLLRAPFTRDAISWFKGMARFAGGEEIVSQGNQVRVRLPRFSVSIWTLAVFCVLSFSGAFLVPIISAETRDDSPWLVAEVWAVILVVTAATYVWRRSRLHSGIDDLVIDEGAQTVSLPSTFGRKTRSSLDFNSIQTVYLQPIRHEGKSRFAAQTSFTWGVMLQLRGACASPERIANRWSAGDALVFVAWLRERLHLPGFDVQPPVPSNAFSLSSSVG